MTTTIKNEVTATEGNSGRPVSREVSAGDITVRVSQMPDRRWVAYPDYASPDTAAFWPYQMPQHDTEEDAVAFARASIRAAEANVAGAMSLGDAIKALASYVSAIGDDYEFSARAKWAARILGCRAREERITAIDITTTDIRERSGQGTLTLVVAVSLVSLYGETRTAEVRIPNVAWRNVSKGGRIVEAVYISR